MIKANDWLLREGHISEIKRGRRSAENTARLADAYANGTRFTDWEPAESTNTAGETVIKNVARSSGSEIENYSEGFVRYDGGDDSWVVREIGSNKIRSIKEVCHNCGYSLMGHICADMQPRIVTLDGNPEGVRVTISPK